MAAESSPYIPPTLGFRLEKDELVIELHHYDLINDVKTPKNVSGWIVGFGLLHPQDEGYQQEIANGSALITRPANHIVRLRGKTPFLAGFTLGSANVDQPYQVRYFQVVHADGATRTILDTDISIVKRLPESANKPGPQLAEAFELIWKPEEISAVSVEIKTLLQSQMAELITRMSNLENDEVLTVTNYTALTQVVYGNLTRVQQYTILEDEETGSGTVYPGPYLLYPSGRIVNALNGEELRAAQ
jgi:hypothetical protein